MTEPLAGQRVVVTRARHQAGSMARAFEEAGATVAFLPLIEIVEPDDPRALADAAARAGELDGWIFTSANAVDAFFPRLPGPVPSTVRIAVVGPATAQAVRRHGGAPHVEASKSDAEGLVEELRGELPRQAKVLVPQADDARPALVDGLRSLGVQVEAVDAYSKRLPAGAADQARELFAGQKIGWVTFTSPRIVRHFAALFGESWGERRGEVRALSIGPVTTRELRRRGVEEIHEAKRPSPEELVQAVSLSG